MTIDGPIYLVGPFISSYNSRTGGNDLVRSSDYAEIPMKIIEKNGRYFYQKAEDSKTYSDATALIRSQDRPGTQDYGFKYKTKYCVVGNKSMIYALHSEDYNMVDLLIRHGFDLSKETCAIEMKSRIWEKIKEAGIKSFYTNGATEFFLKDDYLTDFSAPTCPVILKPIEYVCRQNLAYKFFELLRTKDTTTLPEFAVKNVNIIMNDPGILKA